MANERPIVLFLTLLPHSHLPHVPLTVASTSTGSLPTTLAVDCWARGGMHTPSKWLSARHWRARRTNRCQRRRMQSSL